MRYLRAEQYKNSRATDSQLGIPACKKRFSEIVLSIIAIILSCVRGWEGRGLRDFAREFQMNVDGYEDDD